MSAERQSRHGPDSAVPRGAGRERGGRGRADSDFKAARPDSVKGWRSQRGRGLELRVPHPHPHPRNAHRRSARSDPELAAASDPLGARPSSTAGTLGALTSPSPPYVRARVSADWFPSAPVFSKGSPTAPPTFKSKPVVASMVFPLFGTHVCAPRRATASGLRVPGPRERPGEGDPPWRPPPRSPSPPGGSLCVSEARASKKAAAPASEAAPPPTFK